jgi:hypothetical protein
MTNSSEGTHPLVKKVLTAKPPIAELIGFVIEGIGDGHAVGSLTGARPARKPAADRRVRVHVYCRTAPSHNARNGRRQLSVLISNRPPSNGE